MSNAPKLRRLWQEKRQFAQHQSEGLAGNGENSPSPSPSASPSPIAHKHRAEITSRDLPISDPISIGLGSTEAAGPATATTWLTVQAVNGSLQYLPDTVLVKPGRYVQVSTVFIRHAKAPSRCGAAPTAAPTKPGVTNTPIRSTAAPTMHGTLQAIRTDCLRDSELHAQIGA